MGTPTDLSAARSVFDLPDDVAYLNTAYMGPLSREAVRVGAEALARKTRPWRIGAEDFREPVDDLRSAIAGLLGAPNGLGVAITPSVSYGVTTAAANLRLESGRGVLVLEDQFPSDYYAWEDLARRHGGELHAVARPQDDDWTAAILADLDRLGSDVGAVSVPPCHWIDGGLVDLEAVSAETRRRGISLAVDTCQGLGAMPFDVSVIRPDFVFGATYKWLLGPYSLGFLWAAPEHHHGRPIEFGWTTRANSDDLTGLTDYVAELHPGARRYDMGQVANFAAVPVALAGIDLVSGWGPERTAEHARRLTDRVADGARALGLGVADDALRAPHLLGVRLGAGIDPSELADSLAGERVHVSVRADALRVSCHAFNTTDDVDRLLEMLGRVVGRSDRLSPRGRSSGPRPPR